MVVVVAEEEISAFLLLPGSDSGSRSVWYFSLYCSLKTCHLVDWFGDLIRTSTMESLIPQLHSLTLEISHELSIQLGES